MLVAWSRKESQVGLSPLDRVAERISLLGQQHLVRLRKREWLHCLARIQQNDIGGSPDR